MSIIDTYTAQTATWRAVKRDSNGEPVRNIDGEVEYDDHTISVRWEHRRSIVLNNRAEEVRSEARVYTTAQIETGDTLIDETGRPWPVLAVSPRTSLGGKVLFREVSV